MTINSSDPADNGKGTKKESKVGLVVTFVTQVALTGLIGWLGNLDLSTLPGWAAAAGTLAVSSLIGYAGAWLTKNTPARSLR